MPTATDLATDALIEDVGNLDPQAAGPDQLRNLVSRALSVGMARRRALRGAEDGAPQEYEVTCTVTAMGGETVRLRAPSRERAERLAREHIADLFADGKVRVDLEEICINTVEVVG